MIYETKDSFIIGTVHYDYNDKSFLKRVYFNNKETIEDPIWKKESKSHRWIHKWESHVPEPIRRTWDDISIEAKALAFIMGEQQAEKEEYD